MFENIEIPTIIKKSYVWQVCFLSILIMPRFALLPTIIKTLEEQSEILFNF